MKPRGTGLVVVGCLALVCTIARAAGDANELNQLAIACDQRIDELGRRIAATTVWSNVFMIAGASIAALGSALAGFLKQDGARKVGAVIGAMGAVLSVLPKALPDRTALEAVQAAADKNRIVGLKVQAQLPYLRDEDFIRENAKYAVARFTECRSLNPDPKIPAFPTPPSSSLGDASLRSFETAAYEGAPSEMGCPQGNGDAGRATALWRLHTSRSKRIPSCLAGYETREGT